MPKRPISISLEESLIDRLDALCDLEGSTRTAIIERALHNDLPDQESYQRMLENPVLRVLQDQISRSPVLLQTIAAIMNEKLTPDQLAEVREIAREDRERAKSRVVTRRKLKEGGPDAAIA